MPKHLERAIDKLRKQLIQLGAMVEENFIKSINSYEDEDTDMAQEVIDNDNKIDQIEIDIEEECLKILALNQPVAIDLRYIVAALKINNDLERIGDLSTSIAYNAIQLIEKYEGLDGKFSFSYMFDKVRFMIKESLDSLVEVDKNKALKVISLDDEVDKCKKDIVMMSKREINSNPSKLEKYLLHISLARKLERIADLTTNIAEDVVYMVDGDIIRHHRLD